ncbi:MAG: hypothetical protein WB555_18870 [Candidatus Korobacteraceae bacterium]
MTVAAIVLQGVDVYEGVPPAGIVAQQTQMLCGRFEVDFGFVFGVLGDLKIGLRHGAVLIQIFRALELAMCKCLVGDSLAVIRKTWNGHRAAKPVISAKTVKTTTNAAARQAMDTSQPPIKPLCCTGIIEERLRRIKCAA